MTQEEEIIFTEKITQTILPIAINMTEEQIHNIIQIVEKENQNLPKGFGNMLFEQIIIQKYKSLKG